MNRFAHLYNAPKSSGFKFRMVICDTQDLSKAETGMVEVKYADSKREARGICNLNNAKPHNF